MSGEVRDDKGVVDGGSSGVVDAAEGTPDLSHTPTFNEGYGASPSFGDYEGSVKDSAIGGKAYEKIMGSDAAESAAKKKEDRAAFAHSLGNVGRALGNLYGVSRGGLNTYSTERADKEMSDLHDRYDKARQSRVDNDKAFFNYYQQLRDQYAKERTQGHTEAGDRANLELQHESALSDSVNNWWKNRGVKADADYTAAKAVGEEIDNATRDEANRATIANTEAKTKESNATAGYTSAKAGEVAADAASERELRKAQEYYYRNGGKKGGSNSSSKSGNNSSSKQGGNSQGEGEGRDPFK